MVNFFAVFYYCNILFSTDSNFVKYESVLSRCIQKYCTVMTFLMHDFRRGPSKMP